MFTVSIVFFSLSVILISLRTYVRGTIKAFGLDDWCAIFSCMGFGMYLASMIIALCNGLGQHIDKTVATNLAVIAKVWLSVFMSSG